MLIYIFKNKEKVFEFDITFPIELKLNEEEIYAMMLTFIY